MEQLIDRLCELSAGEPRDLLQQREGEVPAPPLLQRPGHLLCQQRISLGLPQQVAPLFGVEGGRVEIQEHTCRGVIQRAQREVFYAVARESSYRGWRLFTRIELIRGD